MIDKDSNAWFYGLSSNEARDLWAEYCDNVNYVDDKVWDNDLTTLKEIGVRLSDIYHATRSEQYYLLDRYVTINGYGHPVSSDRLEKLIDVDALHEWSKEKAND